jgi:hypothetical protein
MNREIHVRICKRLEVRLLGPTWLRCSIMRHGRWKSVQIARRYIGVTREFGSLSTLSVSALTR